MFDKYVATHLWVYAVVINQFGIVAYAAADDVFALQKVYAPERRVRNKDVLNGYVLAVVQLQ